MKNKKGFTLIELLAVIIVLAIIMVFAVPAVMNTSSNAQQKSFQLYAKRVLSKASEYVETQKMLGTSLANPTYLSLATVGLNADASYGVCVKYVPSGDSYTLTLYMTNGTYCYKGTTNPGNNSDAVAANKLNTTGCGAASTVDATAAKCK